MVYMPQNNNNNKGLLINILTRTSNRPIGFYNCYQSIKNQTHNNINHFVSFDNYQDQEYIDFEELTRIIKEVGIIKSGKERNTALKKLI